MQEGSEFGRKIGTGLRVLVEMDNNQMIEMNDDIHKFCVLFVSI